MSEQVQVVFGLIGGLALFLYGMNEMSDALQKTAGEKMKKILGFLTKNPLMGALAGCLVTAILQSSSATTVMVIGFVSAGLMSLPQAISVIFGANIGTTMTAQLLAFKISDYIYPIIFIGFMIRFLGKKERTKNIGMVILAFGLLFEGIEIMSGVMKPLASSSFFIDLMHNVRNTPILGVVLGTCMTLVVQSSSATIAVLQNFASQAGPDGVHSVIGLTGAIPILFGDNIGTTITAILASIPLSRDAKRTAIAHSTFNISGTIVFMFLIKPFAHVVRMISPSGPEIEVISRQIANAHTCFNLTCTLIWLPLIPLMVKIVTTLIPEKKGEHPQILSQPVYLDDSVLGQPAAAMYLISQEIRNCASTASSLIKEASGEVVSGVVSESFNQHFEGLRNVLDQVGVYISKLIASGGLTERQSDETAGLMSVYNNISRVTDRCGEVMERVRKIGSGEKNLSKDAVAEVEECFSGVSDLFTGVMESVETGDKEAARNLSANRKTLLKAQKKFYKAHLARLKNKKCDVSLTEDYTSILYSFYRMIDNCMGIAEETLDDLSLTTIEREEKEEKKESDRNIRSGIDALGMREGGLRGSET